MTTSALAITAPAVTPRQLAARKAWETMRARKAAAAASTAPIQLVAPAPTTGPKPVIENVSTDADLVVNVYREPELVPVTEFRFVTLWLDDSAVGCGERAFVVLDMSATKVRLFYSPSLETITVHRQVFDRGHMPVSRNRFNRARIAARIRQRIALADRVNGRELANVMSDGGADAQRVLQMIG